jgi:hypothetical protein
MQIRDKWKELVFGIVSFFFVWFIQFSNSEIIGADGFLHGQMSNIVSKSGLIKNFPQAYFSWFNGRFSDKDFLYHLYLSVFINIFQIPTGTKIGAFIATLFLVYVTYYILKKCTNIWIASLTSIYIFCSAQFLRDVSEARPLVFAISLLLMGIYLYIREKYFWLFIISMIYGMVHLSGWVFPAIICLYELISYLLSGKLNWKLIVFVVAGYLFSFIVHPNFPNNLYYMYLNGILVPWYVIKGGILEVGVEFFPITTKDLLIRFPFIILGLVFQTVISLFYQIDFRKNTRIWGFSFVVTGFLGLFSLRNLTYCYLVYIVFFGVWLNDVFKHIQNINSIIKDKFLAVFLTGFILILIYGSINTINLLSLFLKSDEIFATHFINMGSFINKNIPQGSRIFHTNWSDSQYLIGVAPNYEYIVTLDPIYMYTYNKKLYQLYREISFGRSTNVFNELKDTFGCMWGYAGKQYFSSFINQIRTDPKFNILKEDDLGVIFSLKSI